MTDSSEWAAARDRDILKKMNAEPERNRIVFVTSDSSLWLAIDVPFGMITPPTIELHVPLKGSVVFYNAESYQLRIPEEALHE
jgi:hypothetical protein